MKTTTEKQSKELISKGVDPNTADVFYWKGLGNYEHCIIPNDNEYHTRAEIRYCYSIYRVSWSLDALLDLIPKNMGTIRVELINTAGKWLCRYIVSGDGKSDILQKIGDTKIDAAFELVCYLLDQGIILKNHE